MFILSIKSRKHIIEARDNAEKVYTGRNIILFISRTPDRNSGPNEKYRADNFVRLGLIVSKKIHKKAVVRNKLRRRIKEAFRLTNENLFKNKYDYEIIVRHSIFKATLKDLIKDIENCLTGKAKEGIQERRPLNKNNKSDSLNIKTSDVLKLNKK